MAIEAPADAVGRVTPKKKLTEQAWFYPVLIGVLIIVLGLGILGIKSLGGAGQAPPAGEKGRPGAAHLSRTLEMKIAVDGKELLDLNMKTNKDVTGGAEKEGEEARDGGVEGHEPDHPKPEPKSVSEIEKETSVRFKKHFESLLSKSTPLIELNNKFEKHSKDDAAFQEKTEKSLGEIGEKVEKISKKIFGEESSSPTAEIKEDEKKDK